MTVIHETYIDPVTRNAHSVSRYEWVDPETQLPRSYTANYVPSMDNSHSQTIYYNPPIVHARNPALAYSVRPDQNSGYSSYSSMPPINDNQAVHPSWEHHQQRASVWTRLQQPSAENQHTNTTPIASGHGSNSNNNRRYTTSTRFQIEDQRG